METFYVFDCVDDLDMGDDNKQDINQHQNILNNENGHLANKAYYN